MSFFKILESNSSSHGINPNRFAKRIPESIANYSAPSTVADRGDALLKAAEKLPLVSRTHTTIMGIRSINVELPFASASEETI